MTGRVRELVDLHVETMYLLDGRGRMQVPDGSEMRPPRFAMVRSAAGHRWFFNDSVPDALADELETLARSEPVEADVPRWPRNLATYRELLRCCCPSVRPCRVG